MYIRAVVENYPELSRYLFTYQVPLLMESQIDFGVRILVPFGNSSEPRMAYIIDSFESLEGLEGNKSILAILSNIGEFAKNQFRFLQFVSFYFFIPLSVVLKNSGLFTKSLKPAVFYQKQIFEKEIMKRFRNHERIEKYLMMYPQGFLGKDLQRYLGIKKSSSIIPKLEKLGIIKKTYLSTKIQLSELNTNHTKGEMLLCNGLPFIDRMEAYSDLIQKMKWNHILFISPNNRHREKAKKWFSENLNITMQYGTKFSLLTITKTYDLIVIDDYTNGEYRFDKPISFDLEKVAKIHSQELNSRIILGSYVPSVSSYKDLISGELSHIKVTKKNKSHKFPMLIIRSQPKEIEKHGFSFIPFSVQYEIKRNVEKNKKSVILMNRKGFFNLLVCRDCGFTAKCSLCGIPLSYHPANKKLICQYCGMSVPEYEKCPSCSGVGLHFSVCGTEKIEREARRLFPREKIIRIDGNSIKNQNRIDLDFSIAIGTSMILDRINFEEIDFCCVLGIDSLLNFPIYRTQEVTFHYLASVFEKMITYSSKEKRIIVPTYTPYAEIFRYIQGRSLGEFYRSELNTRQELKYPPFTDLIKIKLESNHKEDLPPVINRLLKALKNMEDLEVISTKPLLQSSPFGIFSAEVLLRANEILNFQDQIAVMIDEFKKNEKIDMLIQNME